MTFLTSDMGDYCLEHQGRVYMEANLTSNILLHAKKEAFITLGHNRLRNVTDSLLYERRVSRRSHGTQITKGNKQTI